MIVAWVFSLSFETHVFAKKREQLVQYMIVIMYDGTE